MDAAQRGSTELTAESCNGRDIALFTLYSLIKRTF
jgi:hypothetical protein